MRGKARGTQTHARARGATGTVPHPRPQSPARAARPGPVATTKPFYIFILEPQKQPGRTSVCVWMWGGHNNDREEGGENLSPLWRTWDPLRSPLDPGWNRTPCCRIGRGGGRLAERDPASRESGCLRAAPPPCASHGSFTSPEAEACAPRGARGGDVWPEGREGGAG